MIKVLSIGNSFSQDAQRYLHNIAKNEGVEMKCVNLYIGGCPLRTHYINMLENKKAYDFEFNGENTGLSVCIKDALLSDEWDYVTLQQVSHNSPYFDTYTPYIEKLADYVRTYVPKAKILIHQTWAYEQGSDRLVKELGFTDQHDMLDMIKESYSKAAECINADGIIRCGEAMMKVLDSGIEKIHRDTYHADLGIGRYMLAGIWYKTITGKKIEKTFTEFDIEVSPEKEEFIRRIVNEF